MQNLCNDLCWTRRNRLEMAGNNRFDSLTFNLSLQRCKYKFKTVPRRGVVSGQPTTPVLLSNSTITSCIRGVGFALGDNMIGSEYLF